MNKETDALVKQQVTASEEYLFLAAAQRGDSAAFETLCKQAASTVSRVARRIVRNNEDAEDVMQESFQQAFVHLKNFKGDSRFSTWLSRIAINSALMKLRKRKRPWDVSLDTAAEIEASLPLLEIEDPGLNPEQLCAQQELQRSLSKALTALTPRTRKAIELRELDELSTEETARIMGISAGAVKARVFHGRRKLHRTLSRFAGSARKSASNVSRTNPDTQGVAQDHAWSA